MPTNHRMTLVTALAAAILPATLAAPMAADEPVEALQRFVEDYRNDIMAVSGVFGIRVDDAWWHVVTSVAEGGGSHAVELHDGQPDAPAFFFYMDRATLDRLDRGTLNPGTAMVKAFSTDSAPMDVDFMEGFQPDESFMAGLLKVTFHFWTRGFPEIVPLGTEHARLTHGGNAVVLYYQPGFRSGWFSIEKGQHVNEDPRSQSNPFPTLFVVTEGRGTAKIGGAEVQLEAGQSMFVPAGVTHEFWNQNDEPMQGILVMFGEGA